VILPGTITGSATPSGVSLQLPIGTPNIPLVPKLAPGDTLTLTATAYQAIPAFSLTTTLPIRISITSPSLSLPLTVPRTTDFVVTHTTTADTSVQFYVLLKDALSVPNQVVCLFPATDSSATVPTAALAQLPVGTMNGELGLFQKTTTKAGDVDIELDVQDGDRITGTFE
jgi:hypothetical protein